jgi:hypothetical protein
MKAADEPKRLMILRKMSSTRFGNSPSLLDTPLHNLEDLFT